MKKLGFIGAGNMGEAMIRGILAANLLPASQVLVHDPRPGRGDELHGRFGVTVSPTLPHLVEECETVVFAVKPQVLPDVLDRIRTVDRKGRLYISVAAGVKSSALRTALGEECALVRAMPNTPALVGMGSTGLYFAPGVSPEQRERATTIFSSFGKVAEFPREEILDVVTALSGSGPAFAFLFIEAMADGAVRSGMGRPEALLLAASTVEGAARMVLSTGKHPGELKDMVTSPGGTTAEGLAALERGAFRGTVMDAVFAAWQRCRELSS